VRRAPTKPPYDLTVVPAQEPVDVERFVERLVDALLSVKDDADPPPHTKEEPMTKRDLDCQGRPKVRCANCGVEMYTEAPVPPGTVCVLCSVEKDTDAGR